MNETNLKNFEFEDYLLDNVKLFDEVLNELGEPPLFENDKFSPFSNYSITARYLALQLNSSKANTLPIVIWFESDDLRIDIEQMSETFEWSNKQIAESRENVIELIRNLFTGFVLIETHGASRFVQIFDADGFFVQVLSYNNLLHMFTGLYLFRHKNYRRLYQPAFFKTK